MCSSEAISCEFKLCWILPNFSIYGDHLFSQSSSPRFGFNLRKDRPVAKLTDIMKVFVDFVQHFDFFRLGCGGSEGGEYGG